MKPKLFLDYDMTIVNSIKTICDMYNEQYQYDFKFIPARHELVNVWDFKDQCPLLDSCEKYFSSKKFFEKVDFINGNTKETIEKLTEKYHVIICSIGTPSNLAYKSLWLEKNLPCVEDYVLLRNQGTRMNKAVVDMKDSIFVDDVISNLDSSNAIIKIVFGDEYSWNKNDKYARKVNWTDLGDFLIF